MRTKGYKTALFLSVILVISAIAPIAIADYTPIIEFIDPTPANNAEVTEDYVAVNVSVSNVTTSEDVFYDQVWLDWDGTNYTMNTTGRVTEGSSTKYIFDYTVTNLTNGMYNYKVYANVTKVNPNNTTETFLGVSDTRSVTINKTEGASFDLQLGAGWNLISIPLAIDNTSINAVFPNANDGDELYAYVNNTWKPATYYAGYGWDGDFEIKPDKGYWYSATTTYTATIKGTEAGTRSVSIAEGWNLIGYTRLSDANLSEVLSNVTNEDELYAYNGEWIPATYYSGYGWDGELSKMEPGKGYWYSANAPFIWEY